MFKHGFLLAVGSVLLIGLAGAARADQVGLDPWIYDPDNVGGGALRAEWVANQGVPDGSSEDSRYALLLQKFLATDSNTGVGASITGLPSSYRLTELGFDFRNDGHCGAGAPRFNVYTSSGVYYFFGCYYGTQTPAPGDPQNWTRVRFSNSDAYPAYITQPDWPGFGSTNVYAIDIVFDEGTDQGEGFVYLDNIDINGNLIGNPTPTVSVSDAAITEGNNGLTRYVRFTVKLSAPSPLPVKVHYATSNRSALAAVDYTAREGDLQFNPGVQTRTLTVAVVGDNLDELNERFALDLSSPVNAVVAPFDGTLSDKRGVGVIHDNDPAPSLSINDASVVTEPASGQPDRSAVFTISLSTKSGRTVTVQYSTVDGTATAGDDYSPVTGTVTFPAGSLKRTITVPVRGDGASEGKENFVVNLSAPVNATVTLANATLTDSRGVGTIID